MASYRVLVTGSRDWDDEYIVEEAFALVLKNNTYNFPVTLIHGTAAGLDTLAARKATQLGWNIEAHPAQWNKHDPLHPTHPCPNWHNGLPVCKMAGHRRNSDMVRSGADICLAFIRNFSKGATGCANLSQSAGIPTRVWRNP